MSNTNSIASIFANTNFDIEKPAKASKVSKLAIGSEDVTTDNPNGHAFGFAAVFSPQAGKAWHGLGEVMEETPTSGLQLLEKVGLDSENFGIHVLPRVMPSVKNPGLYLPTSGSQVVATWGEKQFEMNASVSASWANFSWENALLPPKELEEALIPFGLIVFDNGAKACMQYLVGDIGEGGFADGNAYLLTIMGSLDGSMALSPRKTIMATVCMNTMMHVKAQAAIGNGNLKRTANAYILLDDWKSSLVDVVESTSQYQKTLDKMLSRKIVDSEKREFFSNLFGKSLTDNDLSDRQTKSLEKLHVDFLNHLDNDQPGVEDIDTSTVFGWAQGVTSWTLRSKRTNIHGYTGDVNLETVRLRSRYEDVLNTDTTAQPALQYLYQLVA